MQATVHFFLVNFHHGTQKYLYLRLETKLLQHIKRVEMGKGTFCPSAEIDSVTSLLTNIAVAMARMTLRAHKGWQQQSFRLVDGLP